MLTVAWLLVDMKCSSNNELTRGITGGSTNEKPPPANIPTSFPQVYTMTNYIMKSTPIEHCAWLYKTDGIHVIIVIEGCYMWIRTGYDKYEYVGEQSDKLFIPRTILDGELYNGLINVFDSPIVMDKDLNELPYRERMAAAAEFVNNLKNTFSDKYRFETSAYYPVDDWESVLDTLKRRVSPVTGAKIDGIIIQRTDLPYYPVANGTPSIYKLKPPRLITIDMRVHYVPEENLYYLYVQYDVKQFIKCFSRMVVNNKYHKKHTNIDKSKTLPPRFEALYVSPYSSLLHKLVARKKWDTNGYHEDDISSINTLMDQMIQFPMNYNNKIIELSLADDGWVPMRVRTDKTVPNSYSTAISNTNALFAPISLDVIYFSQKLFFDKSITTAYHEVSSVIRGYIIDKAIHKHLLETTKAKPLMNRKGYACIDLAGGRGADLIRLLHAGISDVFAIDSDRDALTAYVMRGMSAHYAKWKSVTGLRNSMPSSFTLSVAHGWLCDNNAPYVKDIKSRAEWRSFVGYKYDNPGVDVILMNYAIHYLCCSRKIMRSLGDFVRATLSKGGRFVVTCFDGDAILKDVTATPNGILKLKTFNISLDDMSDKNITEYPQMDKDSKFAKMPLPTIDSTGYRLEPLVLRTFIDAMGLKLVDTFNPCLESEEYMNDIENHELVTDYLRYVVTYVFEIE